MLGLLHHFQISRFLADRVCSFQINSIGSRSHLELSSPLASGPREIDVQDPSMKLLCPLTLLTPSVLGQSIAISDRNFHIKTFPPRYHKPDDARPSEI
jgi:hypothetical protein